MAVFAIPICHCRRSSARKGSAGSFAPFAPPFINSTAFSWNSSHHEQVIRSNNQNFDRFVFQMPPQNIQGNDELRITLDQWRIYRPGEKVTGRIARKTELTNSKIDLNLRFQGRAKIKKIEKGPRGTRFTYRRRSEFFGDETCWSILQGQALDSSTDESLRTWPFEIDIPMTTSQEAPLAPSYVFRGEQSKTTFHGYAEYYLEAEMAFTEGKKPKSVLAVLPIRIMPALSSKLLDFGLSVMTGDFRVQSYGLVQDTKEKKLTFAQRRKQVFKSPECPLLNAQLEVTLPTRLQIGSPVPFRLRVIPDEQASVGISNAGGLEYQLTNLRLSIKTTIDYTCPREHTFDQEYKFNLGSFPTYNSFKPVPLPVGTNAVPLNLGDDLQIILGEKKAEAPSIHPNWKFTQKLYPGFESPIIALKDHVLNWEAMIRVADVDKPVKCSGSVEIDLLGRSEDEAVNDWTPAQFAKDYSSFLITGGALGAFAGGHVLSALAGF